jgi:hypothetical protein
VQVNSSKLNQLPKRRVGMRYAVSNISISNIIEMMRYQSGRIVRPEHLQEWGGARAEVASVSLVIFFVIVEVLVWATCCPAGLDGYARVGLAIAGLVLRHFCTIAWYRKLYWAIHQWCLVYSTMDGLERVWHVNTRVRRRVTPLLEKGVHRLDVVSTVFAVVGYVLACVVSILGVTGYNWTTLAWAIGFAPMVMGVVGLAVVRWKLRRSQQVGPYWQ